MIERSDRVVPSSDMLLGDEVRFLLLQSGSTTLTIVWGANAEPPVFFIFPAALL